uniref:Copine 1 n=1 Tax=Serinus canaria TaxID=9135 RepID=A0A8C9NEW4_SERCA
MAACLSRVELSVACRSLLDGDLSSSSAPVFVQLDHTEKVKNCQDPEFCKKLVVDCYFKKVRKLKFGMYDIDNKSFDLNDDGYLGGIEWALGQQNSVISCLHFFAPKISMAEISVEEIKDTRFVYQEIEAQNLDKKGFCVQDFLGKSDQFLEFDKQSNAGAWQLIYRAEVEFPHTMASLPNAGACPLCASSSFQMQCVEYECIRPEKKQKKNNYKNSCIIRIKSCKIETEYSFLDCVGVDFTSCSGDPKSRDCFHYISPDGINEYLIAIWSVGSVHKLFPAFGFGAQVPPSWQVSHEFALNFNPTFLPCVVGIQGIVDAYHQILLQIRLYRPTNFSPIINHMARFAAHLLQQGTAAQYFILLFRWATKLLLCGISDLFSPFSFQAPQEALPQVVLAEVPKQLVSYNEWQEWPPLKLPEIKVM